MSHIFSSRPILIIQWNPSGTPKVATFSGVNLYFFNSMLWDFLKWPEYRGGHISGVLNRGVPL